MGGLYLTNTMQKPPRLSRMMRLVAAGILVCLWPSETAAQCAVRVNGVTSCVGLTIVGPGGLLLYNGTSTAPSLTFTNDTGTGLYLAGTGNLGVAAGGGAVVAAFTAGEIRLRSTSSIGWSPDSNPTTVANDLNLWRDAPNTLAQRNGTNPQELRIWNTDAAADEFASLGWINNSNVFGIETEAAGGGTVRNIAFLGGSVGIGTTAPPEQLSQGTVNNATWGHGEASELLTLSTLGTTTDTSANLLPANSIIESVVARITTTITTATSWQLGDATTAGRFTAANSTMVAGTTDIGLVHVDVAGAGGPRQTAAAKLRVTTVGTPGAGVIRVTVFYRKFTPPTS